MIAPETQNCFESFGVSVGENEEVNPVSHGFPVGRGDDPAFNAALRPMSPLERLALQMVLASLPSRNIECTDLQKKKRVLKLLKLSRGCSLSSVTLRCLTFL